MTFDDFTTVATFYFPLDAHLVRIELEHEGIPCFLMDEEAISANPVYSTALGGIKLQVPASSVPRALEILREIQGQRPKKPDHENEQDNPAANRIRPSEAFRCPECGSENIQNWQFSLFWIVAFVLTLISVAVPGLAPPIRKNRKCQDCGHQWFA
ncbi:DUF2007 domain-containing protein [Candidatus Sumerlaeota bacterium]|nr:DUF2007 domain-containing protein [Candidatus Sumerlaeota bacterium]